MEEKLAHKKLHKSKNGDVSTHKEVDLASHKRSKVEDESGETEFDKPTEVEVKKKRRYLGDEEDTETGVRKKKRRREQETSFNKSEQIEEVKEARESKKSKKPDKSEHDGAIEGKELGGSRKKGRRKVKIQGEDGEPIRKKKRKTGLGCTDLPDPEDDVSLANQTRKALTYAYQQFDDPTTWKFNKARQNWLIRNTWSNQAIPELYTPLLTRYLTNVQGGVREKLVIACRSIISPVPIDPASQLSITTTETETDKWKQLRAHMILDALTAEP